MVSAFVSLQAILYGNPVTYRSKSDAEPVGSSGARESSLEDERQKGRVVNLVTDDPAVRTVPKSFGAYSNFKVTKARCSCAWMYFILSNLHALLCDVVYLLLLHLSQMARKELQLCLPSPHYRCIP